MVFALVEVKAPSAKRVSLLMPETFQDRNVAICHLEPRIGAGRIDPRQSAADKYALCVTVTYFPEHVEAASLSRSGIGRSQEMARLPEVSSRLGRVLGMFPGRTQDILQLSLRDPAFRSLCEELEDAHASLTRFTDLPGPDERPEVAEYVIIIAELVDEVRVYLESECS